MKSKICFLFIQLFFYNLVFCQETYKVNIIDSITQKPIANVKICDKEVVLALTDKEGAAEIPKKIKSVILIKDSYFDLKFTNDKPQIIKLSPILSIELDEVIINTYKGVSIIDKIYNVYKNSRNYKMNYLFKNVTIKFMVNDEPYIDIDELFYEGFKVKSDKSNKSNRIMNIIEVNYNKDFYKSIGQNNISDDNKTNVIKFQNSYFAIPFFHPYFKRGYTYYDELHNFFNNYKKFKYSIKEDENNFFIDYVYKDISTKFDYNIHLVIDKNNYCIVNFKKNLIENKKNSYSINLVNTQNIQKFNCNTFNEEVIFKLNNLGVYELVSETLKVNYNCNLENKLVNFNYSYILEPTIPFEYNKSTLIQFTDLINIKK